MKALKILIALCIMLGFATTAVNAQKQTETEIWTNQCPWLPCVGEEVCGDITYSWWWIDGKMWGQEWSGELIGQSTGTVYRFKESISDKHFGQVASVNYHHHKWMVHANGKLVAIVYWRGHNTVNANGVPVNDFGNWWENIECK
jgi:hypothetical protein